MKILEKVKKEVSANIFEGYCLYLYDNENLNCKMFPLQSIQPTLRIKASNETFALDNPAFYIEGKPVFICLRGNPISISMELMDKNARKILIEKGYSASEIDAKINSIYTNNIFRKRMIDSSLIITYILSICVSVLSTILFMKLGQ